MALACLVSGLIFNSSIQYRPCVFACGMRIEFSSVLKNYQHKSIKHPLSPRVQILLYIYPINAIIVDFVSARHSGWIGWWLGV